MKKSAVLISSLLLITSAIALADFTETVPPGSLTGCVPVSNGYNYRCSTDANAPTAQFKGLTNTGAFTSTGGIVTQSTTTFTGGFTPMTVTKVQANALQATTTGQVIFCSNCGNFNAGQGEVCFSTGSTTTGQFVAISSAAAVTACQ